MMEEEKMSLRITPGIAVIKVITIITGAQELVIINNADTMI